MYCLTTRDATWNQELVVELEPGDAKSGLLLLDVMNAASQEITAFKSCTLRLADFIAWNGYHLDVGV